MQTLKKYIEAIRTIPIDENLSDDAVIALTNIHLSLMSMFEGDVALHREAMDKLFAICRKRSTSNQSLSRSSRMTPAMYNVLCMPDTVFDDRKHNSCMNRSFRIAEEWRKKATVDEKSRITEYGVLQSIMNAFVYVVDEDTQSDRDFCYLSQRIAEWSSELNTDGSWRDVSDYGAVRRLDIMIVYSNTYGDNRFDIQKALRHYFNKIIKAKGVDSQTLFYLYRTIDPADEHTANRVAERAIQLSEPYKQGSAEWLWYMAVVIDRECEKINNDIKEKMLAHTA